MPEKVKSLRVFFWKILYFAVYSGLTCCVRKRLTGGSVVIRIVIADDHEIYRRGLTLFVENDGMEVIDITATGRQAVLAVVKHQPIS